MGSSAFARHYSQNRFFFLFLQVLRCFSSLRSLLIHYFTYVWMTSQFLLVGFPHSDIHGSMNICFSPWLFAAYHVLLRLLVPRHSPYALCSLTSKRLKNFVLPFFISQIFIQCTNVLSHKNLLTQKEITRFWIVYSCIISNYYAFTVSNNHIFCSHSRFNCLHTISSMLVLPINFSHISIYFSMCCLLDFLI